MRRFRPGKVVLIVLTAIAVYMLAAALRTDDCEARLAGAGFGGIGACVLLPFWVGNRQRLPFAGAACVVAAGAAAAIALNCWAWQTAGTLYTHPLDHGYLALCPVPGAIWLWMQRVARYSMDRRARGAVLY